MYGCAMGGPTGRVGARGGGEWEEGEHRRTHLHELLEDVAHARRHIEREHAGNGPERVQSRNLDHLLDEALGGRRRTLHPPVEHSKGATKQADGEEGRACPRGARIVRATAGGAAAFRVCVPGPPDAGGAGRGTDGAEEAGEDDPTSQATDAHVLGVNVRVLERLLSQCLYTGHRVGVDGSAETDHESASGIEGLRVEHRSRGLCLEQCAVLFLDGHDGVIVGCRRPRQRARDDGCVVLRGASGGWAWAWARQVRITPSGRGGAGSTHRRPD